MMPSYSRYGTIAAVLLTGITLLNCDAVVEPAPPGRVTVIPVPDHGLVPDAAMDAEGRLHLVYLKAGDIYYRSSDDAGTTFGAPLRVNSEAGFATGGTYRGPDVALGREGRVHVIWYNAGYDQKRPQEEWGVMYARMAEDGRSFEPSRNLNQTPSDNYSLAADGSGRVDVIWMAGGLYVSRSRDDGESFAPAVQLAADPCECCASRAVLTEDGRLDILYRVKTDDRRDMYLATLSADGSDQSHQRVADRTWEINGCPMTGAFLAKAPRGQVAAWVTQGQVQAARLDDNGQVQPPGVLDVDGASRYPVALASPSGDLLVAWKNEGRIWWRIYDGQGGSGTEAASWPARSADRPAGAVSLDGRFLLFP